MRRPCLHTTDLLLGGLVGVVVRIDTGDLRLSLPLELATLDFLKMKMLYIEYFPSHTFNEGTYAIPSLNGMYEKSLKNFQEFVDETYVIT